MISKYMYSTTPTEIAVIPVRHWTKDDLRYVAFGVGVEPFKWWRFGHVTFGGNSHWFNLGPLFIQWSYPQKW
mgnify:CR=1 FL=1